MNNDLTPNNGISIGQGRTAPRTDGALGGLPVGQANTGPQVDAPGGLRGRISGYAERGIDAVAGAAGRGEDPRIGKAKDFVRSKPLAVAALAGVVGLALLNTLRGRGRG